MYLSDFEESLTVTWAGNCPTCSKQYDSSHFPCPVCNGKLVVVAETHYKGISAKMLIRCEHGHIRLLSVPCPVDMTPIQGHNLHAQFNFVGAGFKKVATVAGFSLFFYLLYLGYVGWLFLAGVVVTSTFFVIGTVLVLLYHLGWHWPINAAYNGPYKLLPKKRQWFCFCQPADREYYRIPARN
jgi:hypothetical protein